MPKIRHSQDITLDSLRDMYYETLCQLVGSDVVDKYDFSDMDSIRLFEGFIDAEVSYGTAVKTHIALTKYLLFKSIPRKMEDDE